MTEYQNLKATSTTTLYMYRSNMQCDSMDKGAEKKTLQMWKLDGLRRRILNQQVYAVAWKLHCLPPVKGHGCSFGGICQYVCLSCVTLSVYNIHSEPQKKRDILFSTITLADLNRFL